MSGGDCLRLQSPQFLNLLLIINIKTMNIDKIKKELTEPIYNHIGTLNKEQLTKQKQQLEKDIKLIETPGYFKGNCNDLLRIRNIELNYINYLIS